MSWPTDGQMDGQIGRQGDGQVERQNGRQIDAVLWDFGGVFTASPFASAGGLAASLGWDPAALVDKVLGYSLGDTDHPWHRLERGEITLVEAVTALGSAMAGIAEGFDLRTFFGAIGQASTGQARQVMVELVAELKEAGVANAIVTNNVREFDGRWQALIPVELFDVVVDSSRIGMRKPDPRVFVHTLELLGVVPERAAFLDDFHGHVSAAAGLGITAILVESDPSSAISALRRAVFGPATGS